MTRFKTKLFCSLFVVLTALQALAAPEASACCYCGWWQRGPVRRALAFAVSPWAMGWQRYYGGYGFGGYGGYGFGGYGGYGFGGYGGYGFGGYGAYPYYGAWPYNYGLGPAYSVQSTPQQANSGALVVHVPSSAKVWINGDETKSDGDSRKYYSRGLAEGKKYKYEIRVVASRNGREQGETQTVYLTAGERREVTFFQADKPGTAEVASYSKTPATPVETVLRLHVPADAQITLGGHSSKLTGKLRTYRTKKLAAGQQWKGYTIQAIVERDGRRLVAEETITLVGGATRDLTLDFTPDRVAQR